MWQEFHNCTGTVPGLRRLLTSEPTLSSLEPACGKTFQKVVFLSAASKTLPEAICFASEGILVTAAQCDKTADCRWVKNIPTL